MRKRVWRRRIFVGVGAVIFVVAVALGVVWWRLPQIVEGFVVRAAGDFGLEGTRLAVDRIDFSGARVRDVEARMGGLGLALEAAGTDYTVRGLRDGRLAGLSVRGLVLTVDFTRRRRGLLPDAVDDIMAHFGGGGELVWPVGAMEFRDCALEVVLPSGKQRFEFGGTATKLEDGRVAFALHAEHPEHEAAISGVVRTETLDGEVVVERIGVQPNRLLEMAADLGLGALPEGVRFESSRVELGGRAELRAGGLGAWSAWVRAGRVAGAVAAASGALEGLEIEACGAAAKIVSGRVRGVLIASGAAGPWSAGPAQIEAALENGRVTGSVAPFAWAWAGDAAGRVGVRFEAGVPPLGGPEAGRVVLALEAASYGGYALAPASLEASGWLDRIEITAGELRLAADSPAAVTGLEIVVAGAAGPEPRMEARATVAALPAAARLEAGGWRWAEPALPMDVATIEAAAVKGADGVTGAVEIATVLPGVRLVSGEVHVAGRPHAVVKASLDAAGVAASVAVEVAEVATNWKKFLPDVKAFSVEVDVPRTPLAALTELAAGRLPREDAGVSVRASTTHSKSLGFAGAALRHFGAAEEWSAAAWVTTTNLAGEWNGLRFDDLRLDVAADTGRVGTKCLRGWLDGRDEPMALAGEIVPNLEIGMSAAAASVDLPGGARAEWAGLWLKKPKAGPDGPPVDATFGASAGTVLYGPEVVVTPTLDFSVRGPLSALEATMKMAALVDGRPLEFGSSHTIAVDVDQGMASGSGVFALQPFRLVDSGIAGRWVPSAKDLTVSGAVEVAGSVWYAWPHWWEGMGEVRVSRGGASMPSQQLRVDGVEARVAVDSLRWLHMPEGQSVRVARAALGDIEVTDAQAVFHSELANQFHIEGASARLFGGEVRTGSFALYFPDPDVAVDLEMTGIDAGRVVRELKLFNGSMTGRLRGRLPVGLLAGRPIVGQGYLELDPSEPSTFCYDSKGLFTTGLPEGPGFTAQTARLPYELLEEGLTKLTIKTMRVDLFPRDVPNQPARVEFAGESVTPRARVPIEVVANVNGTLAEVLEVVLRLATM